MSITGRSVGSPPVSMANALKHTMSELTNPHLPLIHTLTIQCCKPTRTSQMLLLVSAIAAQILSLMDTHIAYKHSLLNRNQLSELYQVHLSLPNCNAQFDCTYAAVCLSFLRDASSQHIGRGTFAGNSAI